MGKKLFVVAVFVFLGIVGGASSAAKSSSPQGAEPDYRDNNCVGCHSRLSAPLGMSSRYSEWHMSVHKDKGVSCDKCHGGDPKSSDAKKAHVDVLPPKDPGSRLAQANLPETCQSCHQNVVSSFVESKHYQKLKAAGLGPSCSTCHVHMASQVLYSPEETAEMCATCHNSPKKLLPPNPEIPQKANELMQAIRRANTMTAWVGRLVEDADRKKVDIGDLRKDEKVVQAMMAETKAGFHAFNLDAVRKKADDCYAQGEKTKDALRAKLYPQQ